MQQQPARMNAPCPVCGAEPAYRVWGCTGDYVRVHSPLKKRSKTLVMGLVKSLVCSVCGYIQLFAEPADFQD